MTFTLPNIPSFRLSWRPNEVPTPPTPYQDGQEPHVRRPSIGSARSSRANTPASPKSPDILATMPSIAEVVASPNSREGVQSVQPTISELLRIETHPSQSIMAQDMQPSTTANTITRTESNGTSGTREMSLKAFTKSWWGKPELKTRVAILLVWSVVFIVVLSIYLGLFMNNKLTAPPLQIALILITLMAAFFFFHSLIRVCLAVARPFSYADEEQLQPSYINPIFAGMTPGPGPWGYAQPERPIQVHPMPGQSDAVIDEDGTPKDPQPPPPAYGIWRQTVRVNPAQFYWVRRSQANNIYTQPEDEMRSNRSSVGSTSTRPPSYASKHMSQQEPQRSMQFSQPIMEEPLQLDQSRSSPLNARLPLR